MVRAAPAVQRGADNGDGTFSFGIDDGGKCTG